MVSGQTEDNLTTPWTPLGRNTSATLTDNPTVDSPTKLDAETSTEVLVRPERKCPTKTKAELDKIQAQQKKQKRQGISAEVVTQQQMSDFVKPVYPKSKEEEEIILKIVKDNAKMQVLIGSLSEAAMHDVINAFHPKKFGQGESVIRQGDEGDCLYICEEGGLDIFVARPDKDGKLPAGEKGNKVLSVGAGSLFGELALMYMAPRAATVIVTSTTAKLWALDRDPFKMLLISGEQEFQIYDGWLKEVGLFKSLNHHELGKINDAMDDELYDEDEVIFTQGDKGECFYIVEDGTCSAYMSGPDGEKKVKTYEAGEYFGEIALLTDEPRRATIRGTGEGCTVKFLPKEQFNILISPVFDALRANIGKYPTYAQVKSE